MPVYVDRATGKLYKNGTPLNAADSQKPQVDPALNAELTSTPVFEIDTTTAKQNKARGWSGRSA